MHHEVQILGTTARFSMVYKRQGDWQALSLKRLCVPLHMGQLQRRYTSPPPTPVTSWGGTLMCVSRSSGPAFKKRESAVHIRSQSHSVFSWIQNNSAAIYCMINSVLPLQIFWTCSGRFTFSSSWINPYLLVGYVCVCETNLQKQKGAELPIMYFCGPPFYVSGYCLHSSL